MVIPLIISREAEKYSVANKWYSQSETHLTCLRQVNLNYEVTKLCLNNLN